MCDLSSVICVNRPYSSIMTLGPFALALCHILMYAESRGRKNDPNRMTAAFTLYRGLKLTKVQLDDYVDSIGKMINMPGFTSASFKK